MDPLIKEETLDPQDWEQLTKLGHQMLDDMIIHLKTIREQQFTPPTDEAINKIQQPLTKNGIGEENTYNLIKNNYIPYTGKITRPDWWAFVNGPGSPYGMLTEMVISGVNDVENSNFIYKHVLTQSIDWIKQLLEYPEHAGGVFVSGGSEANFTGLAVARNKKANFDIKNKGIHKSPRLMTVYCSKEAHNCLERSVELLGLGNDALRWVPINEKHQMDLDKLGEMIEQDRMNGCHPFCVVGTAGTVHTGAVDDLNGIANLCEREDLWFHVDGAFGSWLKLSETHKHLVDGLERADSVAVDLHKWMNMPYAVACCLVKDRKAHLETFVYGHDAEYLKSAEVISEDVLGNPMNLSLALSRPAYAVKVFMLLSAFGWEKYGRLVQQNIDQIKYLAELIRKEPCLEVSVPVVSNVVCFRYRREEMSEVDVEGINRMILGELWKINFGMISDTVLDGVYMLRACNVNHRSRYSDFDVLVERIKNIGDTIAKELL